LAKITEDGNSLRDKQWTPTGAGPMVPEEEEDHPAKCHQNHVRGFVFAHT